MVSAIVSDTLLLKSAVTTQEDKDAVKYLYENLSRVSYLKEINGIKYIDHDDSKRVEICQEFIKALKEYYTY